MKINTLSIDEIAQNKHSQQQITKRPDRVEWAKIKNDREQNVTSEEFAR